MEEKGREEAKWGEVVEEEEVEEVVQGEGVPVMELLA